MKLANLPTANIIHRTYGIRYEKIGSAFALDIGGRQYIVTAKHLIGEINGRSTVDIFLSGAWTSVVTELVGHSTNADISVIAIDRRLTPSDLPLEIIDDEHKLTYGQDVFFLGFPYGSFGPEFDNGSHLPFVKKGIVSLLTNDMIVLDGHNNQGFSGGPVVFNPVQGNSELRVASVISSYEAVRDPIYGPSGESQLYSWDNTGLIITYSVTHATDLIRARPIGFPLSHR